MKPTRYLLIVGLLLAGICQAQELPDKPQPMTWKQAAFDRQALELWIPSTALGIADLELTHNLPCFESGYCRGERNPLIGTSRVQGYVVGGAIKAGTWALSAYLRKTGHKWRWLPIVSGVLNAAGGAYALSRWNEPLPRRVTLTVGVIN